MDAKDIMTEAAIDAEQTQLAINQGTSLPVMEAFYTLQGEGTYQGQAAYFIRLGGCDVGCVWCDVKDSWDALAHPIKSIGQILEEALTEIKTFTKMASGQTAAGKRIIAVITGGEPLMYELGPLSAALHEAGFRVHIETSGAYPLSGDIDWVCVSPKKFKAPLPAVLAKANELKVVVFNKSDFRWAKDHAAQVKADCLLYLQPEWSKEKEMLPGMIDYVKSNPQWNLCVQVHKYINVP